MSTKAVAQLEKANANLEPELLSPVSAREQLKSYVRAQRLVGFGVAALARRIDDAAEIARATGSSTGKAKDTIATGKVLNESAPLEDALKHGVSLEQATEIAKAEESRRGERATAGGPGRILPRAPGQGPQS